MNIAIILAGGSGLRMKQQVPKQFIDVCGKPVLAHTIGRFQRHSAIDHIFVVCIKGWEEYTRKMVRMYDFTKVRDIVTGGASALESINIGVQAFPARGEDIVVIHDGVRPLVDAASIDRVIEDCRQWGAAISAVPLTEHIVYEGQDRTDLQCLPRERAFRTVTPQAYRYDRIISAFRTAKETGVGKNSPFIGTMMMEQGEPVVLSKGSDLNIKITEQKDLQYIALMLI